MSTLQISLPLYPAPQINSYRDTLIDLLDNDLDFHNQGSAYASHNFHSFPAKFPPQLPRKFIESLTQPGDIVLDPMSGSGTTILEALIAGRRGIGLDIDPLALLIAATKTTPLEPAEVAKQSNRLVASAQEMLRNEYNRLNAEIDRRWDATTRTFIDNWFSPPTQLELLALLIKIQALPQPFLRRYFELALSSIIITKTGGVSLALDLAHTRPHRAKLIYAENGEIIEGANLLQDPPPHLDHATKVLRSVFTEFNKRVQNNIKGLIPESTPGLSAHVISANTQAMPLGSNTADLIVTSPPYASNAIDYMRAHKFSLVWLGYSIGKLSPKRNEYIGGEATSNMNLASLPPYSMHKIHEISALDVKKGKALHRYYSEMTVTLSEMFRVLKPGKAAIVVVGSSVMRNIDTETQLCLKEIGETVGFEVPKIGVRLLDRDRRMMPAGASINHQSQIQQRMHEEYVIGFLKP